MNGLLALNQSKTAWFSLLMFLAKLVAPRFGLEIPTELVTTAIGGFAAKEAAGKFAASRAMPPKAPPAPPAS